jgi:recombinational DNA repair protein RecR
MLVARQLIHTARWATPQLKRVIAALGTCESCGDIAFSKLCPDCREHSRPHDDNDPYDVVGGEGGGWS